MSIKGFLKNTRNVFRYLGAEYRLEQHYASLAAHGDEVFGLKTSPKGLGLVASALTLDAAGPAFTENILFITGHALLKHDVMKMTSGASIYQEVQVIEVIDANTVFVSGLSAIPAGSETFTQLRPTTSISDLSGNLFVSSAARSVVDNIDGLNAVDGLVVPTGADIIPRQSANAVQIVALTAAQIFEVQNINDLGAPMNLYLDAARTQFICHLPFTPDEKVSVNIAAGVPLFIGASKDEDIDEPTSFLEINFIG